MTEKFFRFILLFLATIYSPSSLAEWENIGENIDGDTYYVDFERNKINNGYLYHWVMRDYLKPDQWNDMSSKTLYEADCNTPKKTRKIYATYHTQPMGKGEPSTISPDKMEWVYPAPQSMLELIVESVCNRF